MGNAMGKGRCGFRVYNSIHILKAALANACAFLCHVVVSKKYSTHARRITEPIVPLKQPKAVKIAGQVGELENKSSWNRDKSYCNVDVTGC